MNKKKAAEILAKDSIPEENSIQPETAVATEETPTDKAEEPVDNRGKLFLRNFFINDAVKAGKVVTKLKGKIFFPSDATIEPGWYVACVIEEKERYGIMDTKKLTDIPLWMWSPKYIKGIFVKPNHEDGILEIHRALPKEKLEIEESPVIFTIPMQKKIPGGASIADIIAAKAEERQQHREAHNGKK